MSLLALANVQKSGLLAEQGDYEAALKKVIIQSLHDSMAIGFPFGGLI